MDQEMRDKLKSNFTEVKDSLEASVTRRVKKYLTDRSGVWFFKVYSGGAMTRSGIPDIIACVWGFFVAIELKRISGKVTKLQEYTMKMIVMNGRGRAFVAYGFMDFENKFSILEKICEEKYEYLRESERYKGWEEMLKNSLNQFKEGGV